MMKKATNNTASCPVETTLEVIGGRWKVLIIHFLLEDIRRFGELARCLGGISPRTLTRQLRELEADGVVSRKNYGGTPPKVEYSLSPFGKTLAPVLYAMDAWGASAEARRKSKRTARSAGPRGIS